MDRCCLGIWPETNLSREAGKRTNSATGLDLRLRTAWNRPVKLDGFWVGSAASFASLSALATEGEASKELLVAPDERSSPPGAQSHKSQPSPVSSPITPL